MESDSLKVSGVPAIGVKRRGIGPAVGLIFVAPLVAEFLLGNLPLKLLPALIVLAPMYGGGAAEMAGGTGRLDQGFAFVHVKDCPGRSALYSFVSNQLFTLKVYLL